MTVPRAAMVEAVVEHLQAAAKAHKAGTKAAAAAVGEAWVEAIEAFHEDPDTSSLTTFLDTVSHSSPELLYTAVCHMTAAAGCLSSRFPTASFAVLQPGATASIHLSRDQAACLLAHMALGSLPCDSPAPSSTTASFGAEEPGSFTNFLPWFGPRNYGIPQSAGAVHAYLMTLLTYFAKHVQSSGAAVPANAACCITVQRRSLSAADATASSCSCRRCSGAAATTTTTTTATAHRPSWSHCKAVMKPVVAGGSVTGPRPSGEALVVFANAAIGFGPGGTQEELLFGMRPEACVATLAMHTGNMAHSRLGSLESCVIDGAQQVGTYTGFGRSVAWAGPVDAKSANRMASLIVVDALEMEGSDGDDAGSASSDGPQLAAAVAAFASARELGNPGRQRELNKAFCGFAPNALAGSDGSGGGTDSGGGAATGAGGGAGASVGVSGAAGYLWSSVGSGHWGCGAFGGHKETKALIQAMAASAASVSLSFYVLDSPADKAFVECLVAATAAMAHCSVSVGRVERVMHSLACAPRQLHDAWLQMLASSSPGAACAECRAAAAAAAAKDLLVLSATVFHACSKLKGWQPAPSLAAKKQC